MNYLVNFEKPEYLRLAGIVGETECCMFYGTTPEDKQGSTCIPVGNVDDIIELMSKYYPEVKNYQIRETLLSFNDIKENDKIRAEQDC